MNNSYVFIAVLIGSLVTVLLRALPFLIFGGNRKVPAVVTSLGKTLPYAVMAMLVVYCLKDVSFSGAEGFLPELIAGALVAGTYIRKRNTLFSIISGTVVYMLLVQFVF